jgi:hypothetical protein
MLNDSQVQAAIAAIIEREQRERTVPPEYIFQRNQIWINRNLGKHLEPVFAEVAHKIGFDKNKFDEAVAHHEREVTQYLKEREPETKKNLAALTEMYREELANWKAALELAAKRPIHPPVIPPPSVFVFDKPSSIYGDPSSFLVDDHIESWNS